MKIVNKTTPEPYKGRDWSSTDDMWEEQPASLITKKPSKEKRVSFLIDLGVTPDAEQLLANLDRYSKSLGWSRKHFYLTGAAHVIANNKDNPDLVVAIVDYLEKRVH